MSGKKRTQQHVLDVLHRIGVDGITKRTLTDWADKGYIPHPEREVGRGQGRAPIYEYSDPDIIVQILNVAILLKWRGRADMLPLALWLRGRDALLDQARTILLKPSRAVIDELTQNIEPNDTDGVTHHIIELAYGKRRSSLQGLSQEETYAFAEIVMQVLYNATYVPAEQTLIQVSAAFAKDGQAAIQPEMLRSVMEYAQDFLSVQATHAAIVKASDADLRQARDDLRVLMDVLDRIFTAQMGAAYFTKWGRYRINSWMRLSLFLLPPLILLRHEGYGHRIEQARQFIDTYAGTSAAVEALIAILQERQATKQEER